MHPNRSPWIHQLNRQRALETLSKDEATDIVIVGGGISGATTAYFALEHTRNRIILLEAFKTAHGATGHNAGQVTSYFERPLSELITEFGFEKAIEGQRSVESAWELLEEIHQKSRLELPYYTFIGHAGLSNQEQVLNTLKNNLFRKQGNLPTETIRVANHLAWLKDIPKEYDQLYTIEHQNTILARIESENPEYIASISYKKGCMNSAVFTEQLLSHLIERYPSRFTILEESPVSTIRLRHNQVVLEVKKYQVTAEKAILCTNGFEHFSILNESGRDVDHRFHHTIDGRIGYMVGYIDEDKRDPTAISYLPTPKHPSDPTGESYYYLTRRPFSQDEKNVTLTCAGGPEKVLPNKALYQREATCQDDVKMELDAFLQNDHTSTPADPRYEFCWHGLMGYTPNGVRRVGPEPRNPRLLYNLGCNGVGILPSIYGARKIARHLKGESVPASIFDPIETDAKWTGPFHA